MKYLVRRYEADKTYANVISLHVCNDYEEIKQIMLELNYTSEDFEYIEETGEITGLIIEDIDEENIREYTVYKASNTFEFEGETLVKEIDFENEYYSYVSETKDIYFCFNIFTNELIDCQDETEKDYFSEAIFEYIRANLVYNCQQAREAVQ